MKKTSYALLLCAGLFATAGFANDNTTDDTVLTEEEVTVIDCDASPTLPECVVDSTDTTEEVGEESMIDCNETPDIAECSEVIEEVSEEAATQ